MRAISSQGRRQAGQALTEFLVVSLALLPLFMLIPVIGKLQDLGHQTQMASRYAAFDASARNPMQGAGWKPEAQLADEVRRRFYSNSQAPIKTGDVAGDFAGMRNPLWVDPEGKPMIARFADITVDFGPGRHAGHDGAFIGASDDKPFSLVPYFDAKKLGLQSPGLYQANVGIKLAKLRGDNRLLKPFDQLDLSMHRSTVLLLDPWMARSPEQVDERSKKLLPLLTPLEVVEPVVDLAITIAEIGRTRGPRFGKLEEWRDMVPADRLRSAKPRETP
ncbi:hypothetical protein HNP55_001141 [Paucibacter oligotrophus]|uniref:TadE-like protein n=1 Tax=Roseateles oligotrophus TaxID=1769250 RepID=A0A840L3U6_9BURK|nr:hypothetical protein [Roseateles oligotrophus]MBB4842626.1 hypothetical protein [Roseateles oligotrophus]